MVFEHFYRLRWVALLVAAQLALAAPALAGEKKKPRESKGARIYGKVRAADGKRPLKGGIVHAYHLDSGKVYSSKPTTGDGEYEITGLPFGYFDLAVETPGGTFVGEEVVSVPPSGKALVHMTLKRYADQSDAWRSIHQPRDLPLSDDTPTGMADFRVRRRGVEFWKSRTGVLILVGAGTTALVVIVASADEDASPILP